MDVSPKPATKALMHVDVGAERLARVAEYAQQDDRSRASVVRLALDHFFKGETHGTQKTG